MKKALPIAAIALFLLLLSMPAPAARSASKSVYWERLDVNIEVMTNGDLKITETQKLHFVGGPFHHGYREFSTAHTTGVSDVSVTDDEGKQYSSGYSEEPYTFKVSREDQKIRIDWYFPPQSDFTKTWKISYVVHGALYFYPHSTTIQWTAVFANRAGVVKNSKVTVVLPTGIHPLKVIPSSKYHNVKVVSSSGNVVVLEATKELPPDDYLGVTVAWKGDIVKGTPAAWQLKHDTWQHVYRFEAALALEKDGSLKVKETSNMYLSGGPYTYFSRVIPMAQIDSISDVSVKDGEGHEYRLENTDDNGHTVYTFTAKRKDGNFEIRAYFPPASYLFRTWTVSYTAHGVVWLGKDADTLKWQVTPIFYGRKAGIDSAVATVSFPPGASPEGFSVSLPDAKVESLDDRTFRITTGKLGSGQILGFEVRLNPSSIAARKPEWQVSEEEILSRERRKAREKSIISVFSIFLAVAGGLLSYVLWLVKGRQPAVSIPADYLNEPPEDASPALVGELLRYRVTRNEVFGSILKLAQEGFLKIDEVAEDDSGQSDFKIVRMKPPSDAGSRIEKALMNLIFHHVDDGTLKKLSKEALKGRLSEKSEAALAQGQLLGERLMSEIVPKFPRFQEILSGLAASEAVEKGYFKGNPVTVRKRLSATGSLTVIAAILLMIFARGVFPAAGVFYAALLVVGVAIMAVGGSWSVTTPKGAEMKARWQAFKRYLQGIDRFTDLESGKGLFEKFLPYAVAFGLQRGFVRKFQLVGAPAPSWWGNASPSGSPPSDDIDLSEVQEAGSGGHVHEAPLPGAGHGSNLEQASNHAFGGLDSISDKLLSMFDTAASPAPSEPGGYSGGGSSGAGGDWGSSDDWGPSDDFGSDFGFDSDSDFDFDDDSTGGFD